VRVDVSLADMSITYTKREIAHNLGCSVRTIEDDADWFKIKPSKGDRNINLYSQSDLNLISQMRSHCEAAGNSRDSFVFTSVPEVIEDEPKTTKITKSNLVLNTLNQTIEFGLSSDPLFDLEILQRISDNCWLLPASRLAPLFGISSGYLNKLQKYYYCGFIANKETYVGNRALWKVSANNS
jgi:hypothetical protein